MTINLPTPAESLQLDGVIVERFPLGKHQANAYVIHQVHDRRAVIIDPGADSQVLAERIAALHVGIDAVLLTHGHWDHVGAVNAIVSQFEAPVYLHPADRSLLKAAPIYAFRIDDIRFSLPANVLDLHDGDSIQLGEANTLSVRHLPGHTQGSVAFRIGRALFTGDTLIRAEAGRFDLPGGDRDKLNDSMSQLQLDLTPDDVICPGHGGFWPASEAIAWLSTREMA